MLDCIKGIKDAIMGNSREETGVKIKGSVVLMKKNVLDFNDLHASLLDRIYELFGKGVSFQLISAVHGDSEKENRGKLGAAVHLKKWITTLTPIQASESAFEVSFNWEESMGIPGAVIIRNFHYSQFFLKSLTLEDVPGVGHVHFICNSWIYPSRRYKYDRVFFTNQVVSLEHPFVLYVMAHPKMIRDPPDFGQSIFTVEACLMTGLDL